MTGTVALDWIVADSEYGRAGHFLDELELLEQRYVLEVPASWVFWTADPTGSIPAYSGRGRKPTAPRRDAARTAAEVAAENPELYHQIQHLNQCTPQVYEALQASLERLREAALEPEAEPFLKLMGECRGYFFPSS